MYRRIIVPLDGSKLAEQVVPYVGLLARGLRSSVKLLQIIEPVPQELADPSHGLYLDQLATSFRDRARDSLLSVEHSLRGQGISISTEVHEGNPASIIISESEKEPDTLIAMCTHGHSGIMRWAMGSVTDKVLHATTLPLLIVQARPVESFSPDADLKSVIIALDGSVLAERVIPYAASLAKGMGLKIVPITVTPWDGADPQIVQYMAKVRERLLLDGVADVEELVLHGEPAATIIDLARETPHSLVALTTHGRSGVGRWMLGSVADRVVRHCEDPVLVIRVTEQPHSIGTIIL